MPRGFEGCADAPWAEYLKWKGGFVAIQDDVPDAALQRPDLAGRVVAFAKQALPLLEYGWALEGESAPAPR